MLQLVIGMESSNFVFKSRMVMTETENFEICIDVVIFLSSLKLKTYTLFSGDKYTIKYFVWLGIYSFIYLKCMLSRLKPTLKTKYGVGVGVVLSYSMKIRIKKYIRT